METIPLSFLVIEDDMSTFVNPMSYRYAYNKPKAMAVVMSSLSSLMLLNHVHVVFAGKNSRSFIKNLLLKTFDYYHKGLISNELKTIQKKT